MKALDTYLRTLPKDYEVELSIWEDEEELLSDHSNIRMWRSDLDAKESDLKKVVVHYSPSEKIYMIMYFSDCEGYITSYFYHRGEEVLLNDMSQEDIERVISNYNKRKKSFKKKLASFRKELKLSKLILNSSDFNGNEWRYVCEKLELDSSVKEVEIEVPLNLVTVLDRDEIE